MLLSFVLATLAIADVNDLRITEVQPDADTVQVTNVGVDSFTTGADLYFSHLQQTGSTIPTGTSFASGESKSFAVTSLADIDGDIWLYLTANFASPSEILSGLRYGGTLPINNDVSVAVAAGIWPSTGDFVANPGAGQSIRATGYPSTTPSEWTVGTPDFTAFIGSGVEITNPLPPIPDGTVVVELVEVASGLTAPITVVEPDDGSGRLFILDQAGQIWIVDNTGTLLPTPLLDVTSRMVPLGAFGPGTYDERGFLGFALHPDYSSNGLLYTYVSEPVSASATADFTNVAAPASQDHQAVFSEWQISGDPNVVDPNSRRELLRIDEPQFNHNGGAMHFGPDGFLHITLGDGGQSDDQAPGHVAGGNAQDITNVYGSMLRIDVDQAVGSPSANGQYNIPPTNPFVGAPGIDEIYLHGMRNPFMFSFDQAFFDPIGAPGVHRMYIADVGQADIEEINLLTPTDAGGNLGWRVKEGTFFFEPNALGVSGFTTTIPAAPVPANVIDPIAEYDHDDGAIVDNGISVIGGYVYNGTQAPDLAGLYVFGDFSTGFSTPDGHIFYLDGLNEVNRMIIGLDDRNLDAYVKGFGQDLGGEIYLCTSTSLVPFGSTGVVYRLADKTVPAELTLFTSE